MDSKKNKEGRSSALFSSNTQNIKFSQIKNRVLNRFNKDECDQLKEDLRLSGLSPHQIDRFFLEEGRSILKFALHGESKKPLEFLSDHVSATILKEILIQDDSSVLRSFLSGEQGLEEHEGWYTQKAEESQIEKFAFLLNIDDQVVSSYMATQAVKENLLTDKIKANYQSALKRFKGENSPFSSSSSSSKS
jgi:hypothetical protein